MTDEVRAITAVDQAVFVVVNRVSVLLLAANDDHLDLKGEDQQAFIRVSVEDFVILVEIGKEQNLSTRAAPEETIYIRLNRGLGLNDTFIDQRATQKNKKVLNKRS